MALSLAIGENRLNTFNKFKDLPMGQQVGGLTGGLAGAGAGWQAGQAAGNLIGKPLLGGAAGALIGGASGYAMGRKAGGYVEDTYGGDIAAGAGGLKEGIKNGLNYALKPGSTTGEVMADSEGAVQNAIDAQGNTLSGAVDTQLEKAANGELTDAGSDWYKARSEQLDINAEDAGKKLNSDLSWAGNTGGGIEARAKMDFQRKLAADKGALLADSADKYALAGINRAGAKEANAVNLGNLALNQDVQNVNADLGYKGEVRNWTNTIGNLWNAAAANRRARLASLPSRYTNNEMAFGDSV